MFETRIIKIAILGLGEVGEAFAGAILRDGKAELAVASTTSVRSLAAAGRLGIELRASAAEAAADADLVLVCAVASSLPLILSELTGHLKPHAIVADLTSSTREQVRSLYRDDNEKGERYVDVAIMGAISMQGSRTPLLAAGHHAQEFASAMMDLGFNVRAIPDSSIGDASAVKLMRSIFAKGLEGLMVESALAAEAIGLTSEFVLQLDNSDTMPMRDHLAMYLRTHLRHARRRVVEMEAAEQQLIASGLPSITTRAAIERYRRTIRQMSEHPDAVPSVDDAQSSLSFLMQAERADASQPDTRAGAGAPLSTSRDHQGTTA